MARTQRRNAGQIRKVNLCEDTVQWGGRLRVDHERGLIRDVKVLGLKSLNGREYTPQALREAVELYEGAKVNLDHPERGRPDQARSFRDRFGKLVRARYVEGKGIYADLRYLKKDPLAAKFAEAAEEMPDIFGLSHNADGTERFRAGKPIVEQILKVRHVDVVSDPATVRSLYESVEPQGRRRRMAGKRRKRTIIEMDDPLSPGMGLGDTNEGEGDEGGGDLEENAADLIEALLLQFRGGEFDSSALRKKVLKVLGVFEDDEGDSDNAGGSDDEPMKEGIDDDLDEAPDDVRRHPFVRKLVERLDTIEARERIRAKQSRARKLIEAAGLPEEAVSEVFMESLLEARDDKAMKKLIEDRARHVRVRRPRSFAANNGAATMTSKDFATAIRK